MAEGAFMTDFSVIIPIYNTPLPALQRCFDSVSALPEVLLIDDGSQAETGTFCDADAHAPTFF